jgi:hypothetical protein
MISQLDHTHALLQQWNTQRIKVKIHILHFTLQTGAVYMLHPCFIPCLLCLILNTIQESHFILTSPPLMFSPLSLSMGAGIAQSV